MGSNRSSLLIPRLAAVATITHTHLTKLFRSRARESAKTRFNLKRAGPCNQRRRNAGCVTYLALPLCGKREVIEGPTSTSAGLLCGIVEK